MSASLHTEIDRVINPLDVLEQIIAGNEWDFERRSDEEMAAAAPGNRQRTSRPGWKRWKPKHFQAKWHHLATRKMRQSIPRRFRNLAANPHPVLEDRIVTYSPLRRDSAPA